MMKGCTGLLRSSAGLGGPADPLVGLLGPVLGMLLGAGLSVMRDVGGEISSEFAPCAFERSPPHLFLYLFYSTKQRWKQVRTLPVVNTGESKLLLNEYLKKPKFFYFVSF